MDFVSGFWQVPIHPDDCFKCGLTTPHGNFEFCRMVMGMQSAPATFQRLMDTMLAGIEGAKTYIDDTFAFSADFDSQLEALQRVFERTREYKLTMNPLKCRFCVQEVVCVGHLVSVEGIRPVFDKLEAVKALPLPQNVSALRRFLGMMEQYRKYIKGYAAIAAPLHLMLRKGLAFVWRDEALAAFPCQELKDALCEAPVLALPNWELDFILTTDWSKVAVGAVLSQVDPVTGEEHPNASASRTLTAAERNYAATEGECLAVKWATEKFFCYLHGRRFKLRTDHAALQWLDSARFTNAKLERWALHLQEFDFEVEYIKGSTNVVADYLSREGAVPVTPEGSDQVEHVPLVSLVVSDPVWPEHAHKQAELDAVPCAVCGDPGGFALAATSASTCVVLCHPCPLSLVVIGCALGVMCCSETLESCVILPLSCSMLPMTLTAMTFWCRMCWLVTMILCCRLYLQGRPVHCATEPGLCGRTAACLVGCRWHLMPLMVLFCGAPVPRCTIGGICCGVCTMPWGMLVSSALLLLCSSISIGVVFRQMLVCLWHSVMLASAASWLCLPQSLCRSLLCVGHLSAR
jgi:hypothetical protein